MMQSRIGKCVSLLFAMAIALGSTTLATAQGQSADPGSPISLLGRQWNLASLYNNPVPADGRAHYFVLKEVRQLPNRAAGNLLGEDGVNGISGSYAIDGNALRIRNITYGAVAVKCQPDQKCSFVPGKSFVDALRATVRFRISDSTLELLDQRGAIVARFTPGDPQADKS